MEFVSGNIYIRTPLDGTLKVNETVVGHAHNFDHTTYVKAGAIEVTIMEPTKVNYLGAVIEAEVVASKIIRATDEVNWMLIMAGKTHTLRALEDGSVYHCIYSHRLPQAVSIESPGEQPHFPTTKVDEDGVTWYREDPKILQNTSGWLEAYR